MTRNIDRLIEIMAQLRNPDGGCPWDLEQNFATIAPYTIEEAYEVSDAIEIKRPSSSLLKFQRYASIRSNFMCHEVREILICRSISFQSYVSLHTACGHLFYRRPHGTAL